MSVNHNFNIEQGSDFKITFVYQDVNGNSIDISDGKVGFRYRGDNETNVTEYVRGEPNGYIKSGAVGEIIIEFPASVTRLFDFNSAIYDLDFEPNTDSSNLNTRISTGTISLIRKNFNTFLDQDVNPVPDDGDAGGGSIPIGGDNDPNGDRCSSAVSCLSLDIYSRVYNGNSIILEDKSEFGGSVSGAISGQLPLSRQSMQKIEVAINGLKHESPQDLTFILEPPSGDNILLSSSNKISKYDPSTHTEGFSWVFSNSAPANTFLNTVEHNSICNIEDKTDIVKDGNNTLRSNFDHLLFIEDHRITGVYNLLVKDTDTLGSGTINNWNLVITYTGPI